ncbi:MAG: GNAT family N-acetyltransferase [Actinomycetota bacterium]|nr:GNAT family N-acetyltransferase [Actinomycetota bacterium]
MADDRNSELEIRLVLPGDDIDAQLDLAERAFGVKSPGERNLWRETAAGLIAQRRCLGAFAGDRPVGGAMFHDMRQWWCGRAVPMAGVASVRVAPEDRGRGIGRQLMTALLAQVAAAGYPLSVLYPATMPLYRSLGWEIAGGRYTAVIPGRSLYGLVPPDPGVAQTEPGLPVLRRAGPGDVEAALAVIGRVHEAARGCGPITWDAATMGRWLADPDIYAYLCDDGFLVYHWDHGNTDLTVEGAEALSPATVRAFWTHLGGYGSIAKKVYARVGPADAFWWLSRERDAGLEHRWMWMLRVIDAPAAIAGRGFPAAVSVTVPLLIADQARPHNSGRWELTVAGGEGSLTSVPAAAGGQIAPSRPAAQAPLSLGARGLAALYAGTPLVTLRQAGLVSGGSPDDDAALDAAFAASAYMLDDF